MAHVSHSKRGQVKPCMTMAFVCMNNIKLANIANIMTVCIILSRVGAVPKGKVDGMCVCATLTSVYSCVCGTKACSTYCSYVCVHSI